MRPALYALCLALPLCACAELQKLEPAPQAAPAKPGTLPGAHCMRRPGGYYRDDGPDGAPPVDLDTIPDAQPKPEPLNAHANDPYVVFGKEYVPEKESSAQRKQGTASWYGRKFQGQRTWSGEIYDMYAMTAAHPTLPIPSYARVTNLQNGKSAVVRINDRGPFSSGRMMDLSYAAARRIGILGRGSAMVEVERVFAGMPATPAGLAKTPGAPPPAEPLAIESPMVAKEGSGLWLQLGAFGSAESAEQFRERVARDLSMSEPLQVETRDGLSRVR